MFKATLVNKDVPLSSVIDMLTEISRQLLSRSDLSQLQSHLQSQLGHQIAYLIEICPEVQRIFSERITNGDRSQNQDAMSRIKEAFSDFISSVADYTRPLVIAVDNAYWLDEDDMELLTHLSQEKPQGLFLVIPGRSSN